MSVKKPYLHAHWRTDPIIHTTYAKSTGLSHDELMDILTKLHLNGNENHVARGKPGYDPLLNIQPVLKNLTAKLKILYTPENL